MYDYVCELDKLTKHTTLKPKERISQPQALFDM